MPHVIYLLALVLLTSCRPNAPSAPATTQTVTDDLGRRVTAPQTARRVLSLAPGNTEIVFALGQRARLVGRTDACDHPPAAAQVASVGGLFPPDLERIIATAPDLVLMIEGHTALRQTLEERGIPVFVVQPKTVDGLLHTINTVGGLVGATPQARALTTQLQARLDALPPPQTPRPRVFYAVWPAPLTTLGPKTFLADALHRAGGAPLSVAGQGDWPRLSMERLVMLDPDVIIAPKALDPAAAGWRDLRATRTAHLHALPNPDLMARMGPRLIDGIEWLASTLR
jgi:iron complex transport system substrate-binding protein